MLMRPSSQRKKLWRQLELLMTGDTTNVSKVNSALEFDDILLQLSLWIAHPSPVE